MPDFWVRRGAELYGPMSRGELKAAAANGQVLRTDQVSADQQRWHTAGTVRGLFADEQSSPTTPPPEAPSFARPMAVREVFADEQALPSAPPPQAYSDAPTQSDAKLITIIVGTALVALVVSLYFFVFRTPSNPTELATAGASPASQTPQSQTEGTTGKSAVPAAVEKTDVAKPTTQTAVVGARPSQAPQPQTSGTAGKSTAPAAVEKTDVAKPAPQMTVVGAGAPYRPPVVPEDDKGKKYAAVWKEKIRTISIAQLAELLQAEDGYLYGAHIEAGLSPWLVELKPTLDGGTNRSVAGGIVKAAIRAVWKEPRDGAYSLTNTMVVPAWEMAGKPTGFNAQINTDKGWIVINHVDILARVPSTSPVGAMTLRTSGDAKSPGDAVASVKTQDYPIAIVSPPRPDRETLLSFWGYVIQSVKKDGKSLDVGFGDQRVFARPAVSYLNLFANQLDGELQVLAKELLAHSAFKNAVRLLEEADQAERLRAEKPQKSE